VRGHRGAEAYGGCHHEADTCAEPSGAEKNAGGDEERYAESGPDRVWAEHLHRFTFDSPVSNVPVLNGELEGMTGIEPA
jgi:hypothetical protein